MNEHDELRDLLTDAVADVEPEYRLDAIRARTSRRTFRRGWYAAGAAVLAAAAVVTAVNLAQDDGGRRENSPAANDLTHTAALYFVGDSPAGPRLYREFQKVSGGPIADLAAMTDANGPDDPDYTTVWPRGFFRNVKVEDDAIEVSLGTWVGPQVEATKAELDLYLQQIVYTVQAATGRDDLPVRFDGSVTQGFVLESNYVIVASVVRAPQLETLALMSVSDPVEGLAVHDSFIARGRASSFEGTVHWEIRRGQQVVLDGFTTAEGYVDHLYPWETEPIDVSKLNPGRYTFAALTDDPSGGAEGFGPFTDTRTIIVD